MAVYLIPVFIVSLVLIALVIFYVISERAAFKELQSGFPEEFAANGKNKIAKGLAKRICSKRYECCFCSVTGFACA